MSINKHWMRWKSIGARIVANPLDNPIFWREFLKRLSFYDPEHDGELIKDFCNTFKVDPHDVAARLRAVYVPGVH
jgi:hypothetical protein